jgi:hypothetical protein
VRMRASVHVSTHERGVCMRRRGCAQGWARAVRGRARPMPHSPRCPSRGESWPGRAAAAGVVDRGAGGQAAADAMTEEDPLACA